LRCNFLLQYRQLNKQVSAVADGMRDAGVNLLLHETQLPKSECAMLRVTLNDGRAGLVNCLVSVWQRGASTVQV